MGQCCTTRPIPLPFHPQVWAMEQCRTTEPIPLHTNHRCGQRSNVARQSPYLPIPTTGVGDGAMSHDRAHTSPYQHRCGRWGNVARQSPYLFHAIHRCGRWSNVARQSLYQPQVLAMKQCRTTEQQCRTTEPIPLPCLPQVWATEQCRTTEPIPLHAIHRCGRWSSVTRQSPYLSIPTTGVGDGAMSHDRAHTSPYQPQVWAMGQCRTTEPIPLHAIHRYGRRSNVTRQSPYLSMPSTGVGDGAMSHDRAHTNHRCGRWSNVARQSPYLSIPTTGVGYEAMSHDRAAMSHDRAHTSSMPSTGVGDGAMSHDRAHTSPYQPQVWAMEQCHTTEPIPLPCHQQVWAMEQCRTTETIPTTGVGDGAIRTTDPIPLHDSHRCWRWSNVTRQTPYLFHAIHRCGR